MAGCCGGGGGVAQVSAIPSPIHTDAVSIIQTKPTMTRAAVVAQIETLRALMRKNPDHKYNVRFQGGPMKLSEINELIRAPL